MNKKKLILGGVILVLLITSFAYFILLAGEGDGCLSRPCRPGLECATPCFIDNKSKETFCAQTMACMQPGRPLEVKDLGHEYKPVSYKTDDYNGSIGY